jgi:hypothetical protein
VVYSEGYPVKAGTLPLRFRDAGGRTADPAHLHRIVREWKRDGSDVRERIMVARRDTGTIRNTPSVHQGFSGMPTCDTAHPA